MIKRSELTHSSINVDFANKSLHSNLVVNDPHGYVMCALGNEGIMLASKAK